tara:strand:+ start:444 stop:653 length:210 start_codon:yes stop_codon:yes gene_type:complete
LKNKKTNKYYFLVGESSGDLHASFLMQSIQSLDPFACFCGVGGPKMEKLGFQSFVSIEKLSLLGFFVFF